MTLWLSHVRRTATVEFRLQMASSAWRLAVILAALLACGVAVVSPQQHARRVAELDPLYQQRSEAAFDGRKVVNGNTREPALRVIRPIASTILLTGLSAPMVRYWDFGPEGLSAGVVAADQPAPMMAGAELDLEFALRVLIGLFAIVVGTSSSVFARYRFSTKVLVSLPISGSALAVGSLVGGWAAVGVGSTLVIGSTMTTLALVTSPEVAVGLIKSAVALWGLTLTYAGALQGFGAIVALITRRAATTIAATACTWLVTALVAQTGAAALVQTVAPVEPRSIFELARNNLFAGRIKDLADDAGALVIRELGPDAYKGRPTLEGSLGERFDDLWDGGLASLRTELDTLEAGFSASTAAQSAWLFRSGLVIPGVAFQQATRDIAGVGTGSARRWQSHVTEYQSTLNQAVFDSWPRVTYHLPSEPTHQVGYRDRRDRLTVAELPQFVVPLSSPWRQTRDAAPWWLTLAGHWGLTWVVVVRTFLRRQAARGGWA